jgi:succinyl-diaminopimelate desuccinylase
MGSVTEELAERTLELCLIPSETGSEEWIANHVEELCRRATGGAGALHRLGNSVLCDPCAAQPEWRGLPAVALVGHLDTVRCSPNQRYEITGDRVYGCGASDMKSGVAVMLSLLERWLELERARPVWLFYDAEEGPYEQNGLEPVLRSGLLPHLDLALVLEPTDGLVQLGCMGTLHVRVRVHGRRAHSARPWHGENALHRAIPLLERLEKRDRLPVHIGELTFYEVITATQAKTFNSPNVVPDVLELNLNVRFAPGRTIDDAVAEVRSLVGELGEIQLLDAAPAGDVHLDHPLLVEWRRRESLEFGPKQAWTDVARFTTVGIPAVNFGPGETAQAHQADEWCSISSLERAYGSIRRFFTG